MNTKIGTFNMPHSKTNKDSIAAVKAWDKMKSEYLQKPGGEAEWNMEKNEFYYDTDRKKLRLVPTDDGEIPLKGFKEGLKKYQLPPLNRKKKLARKQKKLEKTERQMQDIGNRIMFEKTPDTISQKADRKMEKYFKTRDQIQRIKSPLNQNNERQEFVRDTIRLNPKKLIEGKNINNGLLDDVYADKIAKKAKWWGKGKLKEGIGYYDVADMSQVMYDENGPYVVNLKPNESFKPGNTHKLIND